MNKSNLVNISSNNTKSKSLVFSFLILSIGLIAIIGQFSQVVNCAPYDVDRALLDALKQYGFSHDNNYYGLESAPDYKDFVFPKFHMMERKGGRAPTLRLRFGRRSDPNWPPLLKPSNSQESIN